MSFGCGEIDRFVNISYRVFYVNETMDTICMIYACPISGGAVSGDTFQILPNNTLTFEEHDVEFASPAPNVDNFPIDLSSCHIFYKNINQCDYGLNENLDRVRFRLIENYEDRREISPLNFEFTYRFTEEVKAEAGECL